MMNYNDFSCPVCKQKLVYDGEFFNCNCGNTFKLLDDIPDFLVDDVKTREMDIYFDNVPEYYESTSYLSKIYSFFGGINAYPPELMVPIINNSIKEGLNKILQPKNQFILDVACGTGMYTRSLSRDAAHVWGVDLSIEMLKQANINIKQHNLDNITISRADVDKLPFKNNQFNGVSCVGAMQLFNDINNAIKEMNRVIKDGGRLAVLTYVKEGAWKDKAHQEYLENLDIHFFEVKEIQKHLKNNGFKDYSYKINGSMIMFSCTADKKN